MIRIGLTQKLIVNKKVDFGLYLSEESASEEKVLLPKKYVPEDTKLGDELEVFVYKDSDDRPIATTLKPLIELDQVRPLEVKQVTKIGAFLDMGLEKDLLLPYAETVGRVEEFDQILVRLYVDKSDRLAASMKGIYSRLSTESTYQRGDEVEARIYEFGHDARFGTFCAVDDRFSAMIPSHEDMSAFRIGDVINATVSEVKEDGKLTITTRKVKSEQMEDDADKVMSIIDSYAGVLPFSEKASPEVIMRETGLSKAAFKRAIGRLYKMRLISLDGGKIRKL